MIQMDFHTMMENTICFISITHMTATGDRCIGDTQLVQICCTGNIFQLHWLPMSSVTWTGVFQEALSHFPMEGIC